MAKPKVLKARMPSKPLTMPLGGLSKQKRESQVSSVANETPDDAHALWIMFKGREWIVMHYTGHFQAIAGDNRRVKEEDVKNLFRYLVNEGFINDNGEPPKPTKETVK